MRIAYEQTSIQLGRRFGDKREIMNDMQQLYGGEVAIVPGRGLLKKMNAARILDIDDMRAVTDATPFVVNVYARNVATPLGAASWTALQAYRAKGGVPLTRLSMETDDGPQYREWTDRLGDDFTQSIKKAEFAYYVAKTSIFRKDPVPDKARANDAADQAFIDSIREPLRAAGSPNFCVTKPDLTLGFHTPADRKDMTAFHALGEGLLEDAYAMADGYGELTSDVESAQTAVAHALGASSLSGLAEAWNWALAQDTPLLAGQSMLRDLTTDGF
ncbi:MAG TPA: hypothetical protein VLG11_01285 [Candidatus Saccharimonadales bacterium]|nr:hypothetical protein [Candidatus Saccharimonadales bacterium]